MKQRGFSVVELMVTVAIAGLLMMTAVPSFTTTIKNNRINSQVNEVLGALALARSEAAKRSQATITLCPSTTGTACADSSSWENGWIIMVDVDADAVLDASDGDLVVKYFQALSGDNTLRTSGFASAKSLQISSVGAPSSAGSFVVCDSRGATSAKAAVMLISGQTRSAVDENGDGIVNIPSGNVSCPA